MNAKAGRDILPVTNSAPDFQSGLVGYRRTADHRVLRALHLGNTWGDVSGTPSVPVRIQVRIAMVDRARLPRATWTLGKRLLH
ncbi:hypothetical protein [Streptomyces sp. NPDC127039]|uniref:hypothetical protein n=1 Tax=Streptomyces sp. NPDC127039 TaxID=3347115 RepID=UPI00365B3FE0